MDAGYYYFKSKNNISTATELLEKALRLSTSCGDPINRCSILGTMADIERRMGDAGTAQIHVNETGQFARKSI
jgi:hypothetical protein